MNSTTWTVTADVIDGELVVEHDGEDTDLVILPGGRAVPAIFDVGPWGAEEESMDRADTALAAAGWKRVSEWTDAPADAQQAQITRIAAVPADLTCTDCHKPVYAIPLNDAAGTVHYCHDQADVNAGRACPSPAMVDRHGRRFYPSAQGG